MSTVVYNNVTRAEPVPYVTTFKNGSTQTTSYNDYYYLLRRGEKRPKPKGATPGGAFVAPTEYYLENHMFVQLPYENELPVHPTIKSIRGMPNTLRGVFQHTLLADANGWYGDELREANLRNRLITEMRLKAKDQSVNWGQAFAERRMTANLLADSLNRIARSVSALRRGNWREAGRFLKQSWRQAPETWLEYQYGWKPLIQDVHGSLDALKKFQDPTDWKVSVKGGHRLTADFFKAEKAYEGGMSFAMDITGKRTTGGFCRFDFEPTDTFMQLLGSNTGVTNPLLLAWELLPYSFVVDWGIQVGDYISSLDATQYLSFKGGSYSIRKEIEVHGTPKETFDLLTSPYYRTRPRSTGKPTAYGRRFINSREVFSSWPLASAPRFKDPTSLTHVANALSLLASALKNGRPRVR